MRDDRFYVRRIECWDGTFVYAVADGVTKRQASDTFKSRKATENLCARMNVDFVKYQSAMWDKEEGARRSA